MSSSLLFAHLGIIRAMRTPAQLLAIIALPLLLLWSAMQFLGALPEHLTQFPTRDYLAFLAPGLCVAGPIPGAVLCGAGLQADRRSGLLDMLLAAPIARAALLAGVVLSGALITTLSCMIVLLAARLDGLQVGAGVAALPSLICLAALVSIPYSSIAFILAAVIRGPSTLAALCGGLVLVGMLVSDLLLPASLLPGWLTALARLNPLTAALAGARAVAQYPVAWTTFRHEALVLTLVAICSACVVLLALPRLAGAR